MRKYSRLGLLGLLLAHLATPCWADKLSPQEIPTALQPWINWVLYDYPDYTCPRYYNESTSPGLITSGKLNGICQWPARLALTVTDKQAEFKQTWQLYHAGWVALPGDAKHWPQDVQVDKAQILVADRAGVPSVYLPEGQITLTGQFLWEQRPENLPVPKNTGLIELTLEGAVIPTPELDEEGRLWLRQRGGQNEGGAAEENRLELRVYRQIDDDIPLQIITQIELDVAGRHREAILGPVLTDKQIPMSLDSPLPARLEPDGRLRVQVRPGSWKLTLRARQPGATVSLTKPAYSETSTWVDEETWVFVAHHDLRLVEVTGVSAIDPQQTTLPADWKRFPAYQMKVGDTLTLAERRRGDPEPAPDQLYLERQFWLDFDGVGYSVQDRITGTMTKGWRLEMAKPSVLGRVNVNGEDQFITRLSNTDTAGIEVRRGQINLLADSRLEDVGGESFAHFRLTLPAVGWTHDFQNVTANLYLPPGWRLLNVIGAYAPDTWLKQWSLLDLFIVLILAIAVAKLWRWYWGILALSALILSYQEPNAPQWLWLNLLAALALLRVLPTMSSFYRLASFYRNMSLFGLLVVTLPFIAQQIQQSLYPQLEYRWRELGDNTVAFNTSMNLPAARVAQSTGGMNQPISPPSPPEAAKSEAIMGGEPQVAQQMDLLDGVAQEEADERGLGSNSNYADSNEYDRKVPAKKHLRQALKSKQLVQIDPNAKVQTGPGLPQWHWRTLRIVWNGPVNHDEYIQLWLLSPTLNTLITGLRVLLLTGLLGFLLWVAWRERLPSGKATLSPASAGATVMAGLFLASILISLPLTGHARDDTANSVTVGQPSQYSEELNKLIQAQSKQIDELSKLIQVQSKQFQVQNKQLADMQVANSANEESSSVLLFPPQSLLDQLTTRLLTPTDCLPYCASYSRMQLALDATQLQIRLELHSSSDVAVPLPGQAQEWLPQQVLLDGAPASGLSRDLTGQLWLRVDKGLHQVQLVGVLPNRHTVQLSLPLKPHFVAVQAQGWQVEGVHENGLADEQLQFTREQGDNSKTSELEMGSLPPFVRIERTLLLGLDWQVETRVTRLTPTGTAVVLEIPLLVGESVMTEDVRVDNGKALINLPADEQEVSWTSVFAKQDAVILTAPDNTASIEIWRFDASAIWHVELAGIPVVHHQAPEGRWLPEWRPWPGESVTLRLSRPEGIEGQALTIDRSHLTVIPGQRSTDSTLSLTVRSSRGGQHTLTLPPQAQLQSVSINGSTQPIRQEARLVNLPIVPGTQQIALKFREPGGIVTQFFTPELGLGAPSVNTHIAVQMPAGRWILFADNSLLGPAVLFWGILLAVFIAAIGLGITSRRLAIPLKTWHWLLLGMVLSQLPITLSLSVVLWFLALAWRGRLTANHLSEWWRFDLMQLGLMLLTVIALSSLLMAIKQGLLGFPNMYVSGNGSNNYLLRWYQDRTSGTLPSVWVISVSLWLYRCAMLAWALWLAFALLRWLQWGWQCFSAQALWKRFRNSKQSIQA